MSVFRRLTSFDRSHFTMTQLDAVSSRSAISTVECTSSMSAVIRTAIFRRLRFSKLRSPENGPEQPTVARTDINSLHND